MALKREALGICGKNAVQVPKAFDLDLAIIANNTVHDRHYCRKAPVLIVHPGLLLSRVQLAKKFRSPSTVMAFGRLPTSSAVMSARVKERGSFCMRLEVTQGEDLWARNQERIRTGIRDRRKGSRCQPLGRATRASRPQVLYTCACSLLALPVSCSRHVSSCSISFERKMCAFPFSAQSLLCEPNHFDFRHFGVASVFRIPSQTFVQSITGSGMLRPRR